VEKAAVSLNRPGLAPQNVQLAQLLLDRVNPFCADGICGSLFRADQRRPSNIGHWHNRDRQSLCRAIVELLNPFV